MLITTISYFVLLLFFHRLVLFFVFTVLLRSDSWILHIKLKLKFQSILFWRVTDASLLDGRPVTQHDITGIHGRRCWKTTWTCCQETWSQDGTTATCVQRRYSTARTRKRLITRQRNGSAQLRWLTSCGRRDRRLSTLSAVLSNRTKRSCSCLAHSTRHWNARSVNLSSSQPVCEALVLCDRLKLSTKYKFVFITVHRQTLVSLRYSNFVREWPGYAPFLESYIHLYFTKTVAQKKKKKLN